MASPAYALWKIRRARRRSESPRTRGFSRYEPDYRAALTAIRECAGDDAMDELAEWVVAETERTDRMPSGRKVRAQARKLCTDRDLPEPDDDALRPT